ncbi:MAG: type VI secretion system tip protein TssI/VgrG [Polyangiaceae bacterium]
MEAHPPHRSPHLHAVYRHGDRRQLPPSGCPRAGPSTLAFTALARSRPVRRDRSRLRRAPPRRRPASSYFFDPSDHGPVLRFTDTPPASPPRHRAPLPYLPDAGPMSTVQHVTDVALRRSPSADRWSLRGFDFRRPEHLLTAADGRSRLTSLGLDRSAYHPDAFWVGGSAAPPGGHSDQKHATRAVARARIADSAIASIVSFRTDALDLAPGAVFSMDAHPSPELSSDRKLLVIERTIEGGATVPWVIRARAVVSPTEHYPPLRSKPRVQGVQSAVVVGPPGEDIHTDEHGRVQIRYHWQSPGSQEALWVRVNQGWAGAGYGMMALPRIGQEVLVEHLDGDIDHPVITGRVYNGSHPVPHGLPHHRTRSTWKTASVPGPDGHNELTFEDARGRELVHVRAQRDLDALILNDATESVGHDRTRHVGVQETVAIGAGQTISVGASRSATIGVDDTAHVGVRHGIAIAPAPSHPEGVGITHSEMVDRKITFTTGESTLTLEGPNITLEAAAAILLRAAGEITIAGNANIRVIGTANVRVESERGEVVVQGAPYVRINPEPRGTEDAGLPPVEVPPGVDIDENVGDAESDSWYEPDKPEGMAEKARKGGPWHPERWGPTFREFGLFHLGLMARASGLPLPVLLRQAGRLHEGEHGRSEERGDPGNGLWGGKAPYGNAPEAAELLRRGAAFYDRNYH